ncbi:hypothetical protein Gotur_002495, partial [Gossypium turneri]
MTMASSNTPIPMDDVFNEYESALKRQKSTTSKVWDEMTKLESKNKNELKVQCNHYPHYKLNSVQYCFTTIYGIHASDFVENILSNLRLLFDEYVKKSKFTSSSLDENSNVSDKNPIDSSLHQHNVINADFRGDFDKSNDYKWYLNESSTKREKSQLDIYLEEPELELNKIGCKNDDEDEDDVSSIAF